MSVQVPTLPFQLSQADKGQHSNGSATKTIAANEEPLLPTVEQIQVAVARAGRRIAPLWPLQNFVAVNPFLGLADQPFAHAMQMMAERAGATMTAPRASYVHALQNGKLTAEDLAAALADHPNLPGAPSNVAALESFARQEPKQIATSVVPTVSSVAYTVTGTDWGRFVTESISRWAATYFDQGQAYWPSPWRHLPPYPAWRAEALIDRTPELAGIPHFRQIVASLPAAADEAILNILAQLAVPLHELDAYLHHLLLTIGGWAGHARYRLWQAELQGREDESLNHLLAIRLTWEAALFNAFAEEGVATSWMRSKAAPLSTEVDALLQAELAGNLLLQTASEKAYQRQLLATLHAPTLSVPSDRQRVQAAFCIDVRSELFRRALESTDSGVETIGFAGFFGFPIEYVRLGESEGRAQCPALLAPQFVINETVQGASAEEEATICQNRSFRRREAKAWRSFKFGAVSCFGFVGPVGLAYLKNVITDTLGKSRPVTAPATFGLDDTIVGKLKPRVEPVQAEERMTGMSLEQQIAVAAGALTAMSLTRDFARLVVLVGHGSTTVNNPYATGLDCGACGGHTGEANVRVAALVLNNPAVRTGLRAHDIHIPAETYFLACLHDTTTDQITIFDRADIPAGHTTDIAQIEASFAAAGRIVRAERAPKLHIAQGTDPNAAVEFRSRDWSQVRPEWGLAGCAALIVAPRQRTYGRNLGGRVFLHSYTWQQDEDFRVLDLIMTAPMIVASWINLQYYGSAVDNRLFGSGNKVLHNVVGAFGMLEGNGGDLRTGLPWQSIHDGEQYVHEPLRLSVLIEAPLHAITAVIARHEAVRQLLDHGWLYLFAIDKNGRVSHRYEGDLAWVPVYDKTSFVTQVC